MAAGSVLCGSRTARRQTRRASGAGGEQVRNGPQPQNRKSTRPDRAARPTCRGRRGHRIMKRREFITLLGGSVAAWPLPARAARAQQERERMRGIGVLEPLAIDDPETLARVTAFAQGLQQLGWTVGHNVRIDYRWGAGDADRIRQQAAELAALAPDAILTAGGSTTAPMLRATRTVPIVFVVVVDPVGAGYVDSLARPPHIERRPR